MKLRLPSSIWAQAGLISLLIIIVIAVAGYPGSGPKKPRVQEVNWQQKQQATIDNAQEYLITNYDKIEPQQLLILDYLYRAYGLNPKFSAANIPLVVHITDADTAKEFESVRRFAEPNVIVNDLGPSPSLVARAANCDHISLPADIESQIRSGIQQGGYQLTHVALSVQLMKELNCNFTNSDQVRDEVANGLVQLAKSRDTVADLRYESIAFLGYMGQKNLIQSEWINQIVTDQQPDGSWISGSTAHPDHSTVLALWAVSGYLQPNKKEPIIRH